MERHTISLDTQLSEQFDKFMQARGYENRSEAIRDLIRECLEVDRLNKNIKGYCVATLSYIYNHHERALALCRLCFDFVNHCPSCPDADFATL